MRKRLLAAAVWAAGVLAAIGGVATVGHRPDRRTPGVRRRWTRTPERASSWFVLGGVFETRAQAQTAAAA
jgi:hypothetical protein